VTRGSKDFHIDREIGTSTVEPVRSFGLTSGNCFYGKLQFDWEMRNLRFERIINCVRKNLPSR
jgi:hypothetical protein